MKLKEAFNYQNHLSNIINCLRCDLVNSSNVMKTTEQHLCKEANPDAENKTVDATPARRFPEIKINQLIDFYKAVVIEKIRMVEAIDKAKRAADGTYYDAGIEINKIRQQFASVMRCLADNKASEIKTTNKGFKFNVNGDQVPYVYEVKVVSTIDYDRDKVRNLYKEYTNAAAATSDALDHALLEVEVDFIPRFDINETYEEAVESFCKGE